MYKAAIFDMDGTILDTLSDLVDSTNFALTACGYPARNVQDIRGFIGNGVRRLVDQCVLPLTISDEETQKLYKLFDEYYVEHCTDNTRPFPGIVDLLTALKRRNIMTAVVSNKADFAVKLLSEHYFDGQFDEAVGAKPDVARKPDPAAINAVITSLGIKPKDAVYIGDTEVDLLTANNANIDCVLVGWGFRGKGKLAELGAKAVVSNTKELFELISE